MQRMNQPQNQCIAMMASCSKLEYEANFIGNKIWMESLSSEKAYDVNT
jgi:hypothetical protein